ncbi:MAG TPA: S8 family serine peptidase [Micromonosporaceae bacterium]|nr:S8 family serine peptidase [Micromonosporaceae bacterium]
MKRRTRTVAVAIVAGLLVAPLSATAAPGMAAPPGPPPAAPGTAAGPDRGAHTVTLLTGDRVTVSSPDATAASVQRGKGREKVSFAVFSGGGRLYVIPSDAQNLIRSGKVDRRLFDVTGLIKAGYHDAARSTTPLILQYERGGPARAAASAVSAAGAKVTRDLPAITGAAVTADKDSTHTLWTSLTVDRDTAKADTAASVDRIWLDGKRTLVLDKSVPQIGAPAAWQAGYSGKGVTVAVLDTGVDDTHKDLIGAVRKNFTDESDTDEVGHGTHVSSTIAGTGAASGGRYRGVAPDATLVSGKVCGAVDCPESWVLAGMQWAAVEQKARVINMSLSGLDTPDVDPMEEALNTLTAQTGALFVVGSGNEGRGGASTVGSPGSADAALAVGAVDSSDALADFSSRGPRVGDAAIKPDVTAPGVGIVAAMAAGTAGEPVDGVYTVMDGTSMATPHVAGAVALLAQQHPDWKAAQLKAALIASAKPNPTLSVFEQGAGRIDLAKAITQSVLADPPSVSFELLEWPNADAKPVTKTVTYRNTGTATVHLDLSVQAAANSLYTVTPTKLTVPAGGSAAAQVTVATAGAAAGAHTARLIAVGGAHSVITPVAVEKEKESYDLSVRYLDRGGNPAEIADTSLVNLDTGEAFFPTLSDGTVNIRMPKGRYGACSIILSNTTGKAYDTTLLAQPLLDLSRDSTITMDARAAKPVTMTVPDASVRAFDATITAQYQSLRQSYCGTFQSDFSGLNIGQVGSSLPGRQFSTTVQGYFAPPGADGPPAPNSPYAYHVAENVPGRVPTGLIKNYTLSDFATINVTVTAPAPDMGAKRTVFPVIGGSTEMFAPNPQISLSTTRVDRVSVSPGVQWASATQVGTVEVADGYVLIEGPALLQPATTYRAGKTYTERYGSGPFGPGFPATHTPDLWGSRTGDRLSGAMPLLTDADGHASLFYFGSTLTPVTKLYRNGELISSSEFFDWRSDVPAEAADYRLESSVTGGFGGLSTDVRSVFTFRSALTDPNRATKLPLSAVRYTPTLDANNAAPAGKPFTIPVTVQRQPGAQAHAVKTLTVDVSYDDGGTWQPTTLKRAAGTTWTATVTHPGTAGFVSLRAKSTDTAGNSVDQTIIRAYRTSNP